MRTFMIVALAIGVLGLTATNADAQRRYYRYGGEPYFKPGQCGPGFQMENYGCVPTRRCPPGWSAHEYGGCHPERGYYYGPRRHYRY